MELGTLSYKDVFRGRGALRIQDEFGFFLHNDKIFINGNSDRIHCLNANTGYPIWEADGTPNFSQPAFLNDVIYFIQDDRLKAIDENTGENIWNIKAPDSNSHFVEYCAVVPGKNGNLGKVVVSIGNTVYCYEAAR